MGEWLIYGSNGTQKATVKKLEYSGEFMGETSVTCDIYSPSPISFSIGDYLVYRGERFTIDYDATRLKQARNNTYGKGYTYENMRFLSYVGELKKCEFLDFVPSDNLIHFSQLPDFSFYAETVKDLADRLQANLDRIYTGSKAWSVQVVQGFEGKENINVSVSKATCFDALRMAYDQFEATFIIRGRTITIGTAGNELETDFKYGKGNGLKTIERSVDESDSLVTRLRAYGNTTNLPANYYKNIGMRVYAPIYEIYHVSTTGCDIHFVPKLKNACFSDMNGQYNYWVTVSLDETLWLKAVASPNNHLSSTNYSVVTVGLYGSNTQAQVTQFLNQLQSGTYDNLYFKEGINVGAWPVEYREYAENVPNLMAIDRLMLPGFPELTTDPYIDASNISTLGVREKSVYFDGSDPDTPDIHPTLEGMTAAELRAAGYTIDLDAGDNGNLDEIAADATETDGSPITADGAFEGVDEVPGFKVTIKDIGFDINEYLSTETATLVMKTGMCGGREFTIVNVEKVGNKYVLECQRTEDVSHYFPYNPYLIKAGDKFVLTNIEMPKAYIDAASQRLLAAAQAYIAKYSAPQWVYAIKMDDIWMQRQRDNSVSEASSYYWNIKEGDVMNVTDSDLGVDISEVIDRLTIREGYGPIPEFEVVLRKEKPQGTIGVLQNRIRQLELRNAEQVDIIRRQQNYLTFIFGDTLADVMSQLDKKAETWYQANDPSSAWTNDEDKAEHVGDLWMDTSANGGKKTYIYRYTPGENPEYHWDEQFVPDEVFDEIDGKAEIFVQKPTSYNERDMWIIENGISSSDLPAGCVAGDIVISSTDSTSFNKAHWSKKDRYTDDSSLNAFISGTYANNLQEIQTQIDGKAETWYQNTDPSTAWTTTALKNQHKGDIWHNSSNTTINGVKAGQDAIWNGTAWVVDETVPQSVYDTIDGKAAIYVTWGAWGNDLQVKDLFIPSTNTTQGGVTYKANKVYRCTNKSTPTFQEIAYTDDAALNAFLNGYTGTLTGIRNDITTAQTTANNANTAAAAAQATADALDYLKQAYSADNTLIDHGLILSTIVALRDSSNNVWSGISGAYDSTKLGNGIAAWYGGGMIDKEVSAVSNAAKSLFRFDGSGYVANGNLKWDANGNVTIQGYSINATTLQVGGSNVATQAMLDNFVSKAFFNRLFTAYDANGNAIVPNNTTTAINNLKIMVGAWTEQYLSALGLNSEGGGGGTGDVSHIKIGTNPDVFLDPDEDGIIDMSSYAANWNDAYNKRHTHSNKSVLDGITSTKVSHWDAVYGVVPSAAYESGNSLADKNFVNSSISTATATYISNNREPFNSLAELQAYTGQHDKNDYAFVKTTDSAGNTLYNRYKFDGTSWSLEYTLNNSSFTSDQWSAINSGITSTHVTKLNGIASGAQVNVIESVKVNGTALSISSKAVDITAVPLTIITGADDLKAIEGLSGTSGFLKKTAANTWALDTTVVLSTRKVSTGNGLQGGGDLSANRTISILLPANSGLSVASTGLKLDIVNNLTTSSDYRAISATQAKKIWDLLNQMFTLEGAGTDASPYVIKANYGLYTNQFLSALGQNSEGGSGGGMGEDEMWAALQANTGTYENAKINWNHIPLATASTAGAIKVGSTLAISNGILNQATIPNLTADVYTKVTVDTYGRVTQGGDLLADDIPTLSMSKISGLSTALGNVYTKTESDGKYVTALGTNGNYLTYTKNGNANNITVPYASYASALKNLGRLTSANLTHVENGGVQYFLASSSMTTGKPKGDGNILHFHWNSGSAFDGQIALGSFDVPFIQYRNSTPSQWSDWITVLDTNNTSLSNGVININGNTITPLTAASNLAWSKVTGTPTTLSGYGITDAIKAYEPLMPTNTFSGDESKFYLEPVMDCLWAADKRFTVTVTKTDSNQNVTTLNAAALFNGDFGGTSNITAGDGNTIKIRIQANGDVETNYITTYFQGYLIVDFYYFGLPKSISGRIYSGAPNAKTWKNITFSKQKGSQHGIYISEIGLNSRASIVEISIECQTLSVDPYMTMVSEVEWWCNRASVSQYPFLNKYTSQTLYYPLTTTTNVSIGGNLSVNGDLNVDGSSTVANLYISKNSALHIKDSGNTNRRVLQLSSDNNSLLLGFGTSAQGYNTTVYGNGVFFAYGNSHTYGMLLSSAGNVGIGTTSPSYKLHVNGTLGVASGITLTTTKKIKFGTGNDAPYIELDSNGYFHFSHGLYSDSFVSALGANSQGGGGSTFDEEQMWQALGSDPVSAKKIDNSHLNIAAWAKAANKPSYAWSEITNKPTWIGTSKPTYTFSEITSKPTTLSGYGVLDDANGRYYALYGGTDLNPSSTNTVDLNTITTVGSYYCEGDSRSQYVTNKPTGTNHSFRMWVSCTLGVGTSYIRQRFQFYTSTEIYERHSNNGGSYWFDWVKVQDNLSNYASASYFTNGVANKAYHIERIAIISTTDFPTVGESKTELARLVAQQGAGIGDNITISGSVVSNWGDDSAATFATSAYSMIKIGGGYSRSTYGQWLLSSFNLSNVGVVGRTSNKWSAIKWLAWTDGTNASGTWGIGITGNAGSATKLQTARTIWGQSFDGSADIPTTAAAKMPYVFFKNYNDGDSAGYCGRGSSVNNNIYLLAYSGNQLILGANSSPGMYISTSNNVGIGSSSPSYKLHVVGTFYASGNSSIGGTLSVTGATSLSDNLYIASNKFIYWKDTTSANIRILDLDGQNNLRLGYGSAGAGYSTYIHSNNLYLTYGTSRTTGITLASTGEVTVANLLKADGNVKTTKLYLYKPNADDTNAVYLTYDSTNSGVHIVGAGLYSDSYVSALGANSQGGGGSTFDEEQMWVALGTTVDTKIIDSTHIPNLSWSKITSNKPTTLSGYGILDAYTKTQSDAKYATISSLSDYLPLSGGTMTGTITFGDVNKGINLTDSGGNTYAGIINNAANLWIGAASTSATHHLGGTYISAGSDKLYVSKLVNGTRANYIVLDTENYSSFALPLSGGTLTSSSSYPLTIKSTSTNSYIRFQNSSAVKATVGYYSGLAFVANETTYARIGINDSGTPQYWSSNSSSTAKTLLHEGNTYVTSGKGYINGTEITTISGNAATATKLGTSTVGNYTTPIYLNNGTPTQVTYVDGAIVRGYIGNNGQKSYLAIHPEENGEVILPFIFNDIAFLEAQGGSFKVYSTTDTDLTADTLTIKTDWSGRGGITNMFDGSPSYFSMPVEANTEGVIIDIAHPKLFSYGTTFYIDFGNQSWGFENIDVYTKNSNSETSYIAESVGGQVAKNARYFCALNTTRTSHDRLRIHLYGRTRTDGARIAQVGIVNYASIGSRQTLMSRGIDDPVYRSITPAVNGTYSLGTSTNRWNYICGTTLHLSGAIANATTGSFTSNVSVGGTLNVTGNIETGGNIYLNNNKALFVKDNPTSGTAAYQRALFLNASNQLAIGFDTAKAGYNTNLQGNNLYFSYGTTPTIGMTLDSNGNTTLTGDLILGTNYKTLFTTDKNGTRRSVLTMQDNNNLMIGRGVADVNAETYIHGKSIFLRYGTSYTTGLTLNNLGQVIIPSTGSLKIGDATLSWDSTNQMLKVDKGFYSTGAVSALGSNDEGGGSSDFSEELMWQALKATTGTYGSEKIGITHIPDMASTYGYLKSSNLSGYATQAWVNQQGFLTSHQTLYTLSIYGGTTKVLDFKPNANASIYIKAGGDISLTNDTTNKYITLSYTHPTNGANTTISAANGKVLSAITVNSLGHVTSVSSKTLAAADIPDISATYATTSRATTLEGYFTDGVAKTAAKLNTGTTTYTAWGQTYWSSGVPQSVSGDMTGVGSIYMANAKNILFKDSNGNNIGVLGLVASNNLHIGYDLAGNGYSTYIQGDNIYLRYGANRTTGISLASTGAVTIVGATTLSSSLSVASGITLTTTKKIYFGDTSHYLELNSTGFHFSHGVYSDSFVSALGANSSGGGSGTFDEEAMWTALGTTSTAKVIASSHIPNLAASKITSGTLAAARIPIATASAIGGIKVGTTLAISDGVLNQKSGIATAGTYRSVTIDTYGRVTAGTNPTTLSGYGITNAYTKTQVDTALSGYLPLSGGTLTGGINIKFDTDSSRAFGYSWLNTSGTNVASIIYHNTAQNIILNPIGSSNTWSDAVGKYSLFIGNNKLTYNTYTILHSNNTYVSSGKGYINGTEITTISGNAATASLLSYSHGNEINFKGGMQASCYFNYRNADTDNEDGGTTAVNYKFCNYSRSTAYSTVTAGTFVGAFSGNATTATTLQTPRTIWGQSFDGSSNVSGSITGATTITASGKISASSFEGSFVNDGTVFYFGDSQHAIGSGTDAVLWAYGANSLLFYTNGSRRMTINSVGNVGIGNDSPAYKLDVSGNLRSIGAESCDILTVNNDNSSITTNSPGSSAAIRHAIRFNWYSTSWEIGNIRDSSAGTHGFGITSGNSTLVARFTTSGAVVYGEVTATSDARQKTLLGDTNLSIKQIADAPNIKFLWNDNRDEKIHIGSLAQYWDNVLPEAVTKDGTHGYMSLNYGALALCSAITIAREVLKHSDEIDRLKQEVSYLKAKVAELEERRIA